MKGAFHSGEQEGILATEADYVVVGSGAGGGAAARVLAASGRSVVVLEEGPRVIAGGAGYLALEAMRRVLRHGGQSAAFGRAPVPILQGRCVGGTTFVNSAIIWRMPGKVLDHWHREFGLSDGLPAAALDRAYGEIEAAMHVRPVAPAIASGSDLLMAKGAERAGLEGHTMHRSEKDCRGTARCLFGCPHDAKQSTAVNYLQSAVDDGAHVFSDAKVERVVVEGARAVAVSGRVDGRGPATGRRFSVRARRAVIVCASVVQSPNLLRRSGVATGSSALGRHFQAHPGTTVMGLYPEPVNMWRGAAQGYEALGLRDTLGIKLESVNVPPEVAASRLPGAGKRFAGFLEKLPHFAAWAVALRAEAEGVVRPSRLLGGDMIRYELTKSDLARLREGLKRTAEMHFLAGASAVVSGVHGLPEVIESPDQLRLYDDAPLDPQSYSMVATHLFGTCRAGTDPRHTVVDPSLKVHGVDGLYVMDASVFPTNTGVNPQHSIMAVATVAARRLAQA